MTPISRFITPSASASSQAAIGSGKGSTMIELRVAGQLAPDLLGDKRGDRVHQLEDLFKHGEQHRLGLLLRPGHPG